MKKIILFLFAFTFISYALEARIWKTNWPNMDVGANCVHPNGSIVEFDLILETTDPSNPALNTFYISVNGTNHYLIGFPYIQNGKYIKRIGIPHFDNHILNINISHPSISASLFKKCLVESSYKDVCFFTGGGNGNVILAKLAGNSNIDAIDKANTNVDFTKKSDRLIISPNPFKNNLNISFNLSNEDEVLIELLDLSGRVVKKMHLIRRSGFFTEYIETSDLVKGVYYCKVSSNLKQDFIKVVKN